MKKLSSFFLVALVAVVSLSPIAQPQPVSAAFPGQNGKVVFATNRDGNFELYTMNIDGTNLIRLTTSLFNESYPSFSPDGTKIVFTSDQDGNSEVYTMNADGTNRTRLTNNIAADEIAKWSPSGNQIIFESTRDGNYEIYTMNADGGNQTNISNNSFIDSNPAWSPDGARIVYVSSRNGNNEIYTANPDGTNLIRITTNTTTDTRPAYSPNGAKIVFRADRDGNAEIYTMNIDGTNPIRLTSNSVTDDYPEWVPEGTKISWGSSLSGNSEVSIMNTDGSSPVNLTNNNSFDTQPSIQPLTIPPNAVNDSNVTTAFNTATTIDVLANDTPDPYGPLNPASVTVTSAPANGTTSVNSTTGAITYTPNATFVGTDTFTYRVCSNESSSLCDVASVTVTIGASAATPTAPDTGVGSQSMIGSVGVGIAGLMLAAFATMIHYRHRATGMKYVER